MTRNLTLLLRSACCVLALLAAFASAHTALAHDDGEHKLHITLAGAVTGRAEVSLHAVATPHVDGAQLHLQWSLPPGLQLLDGPANTTWTEVRGHNALDQMRRVHATAAGVYEIFVGGALDLPGERIVEGAALYLIVADDGTTTLTDHNPKRESARGSIMPMTVEQGVSAAATQAPNGDPCFAISGRVLREEHTPTSGGYQPMVLVPVRSALIEMREEDILFDDSYGETLTDNDGRYAFNFCDDDGLFDDELELYVRLTAELQAQGHDVVEVQEDGIVEDVYEFNSNVIESERGTYTIDFTLNREQSAIFNMADAILDAWTVWNANGGAVGGDAIFGYQAEVNWEADDEDPKTFYNGYVWDEITVADSDSNPDEWDDSVIIHEWTHQADDNYGCDDNPGGAHSASDSAQDIELAFAEGFANYYQSAVRNAVGRPNANFYLDGLGPGRLMGGYDLETRDVAAPTLVTPRNEAAISALLWDLEDAAIDGQDRAGFGLRPNQQTFTDPVFSENGDIYDDTCTMYVYLTSWQQTGKTADKAVAAIIQQNIGIANFFGAQAAAGNLLAQAVALPQSMAQAATGGLRPEDFKWWQNLTWVVDTSASMAVAGKLEAVKTVVKEQVNDLAPAPKGTEFNLYTFHNASSLVQQPLTRKFYADLVTPAVDALATIGAPDADCTAAGLAALAQAAQGQTGGNIWLYTDRGAPKFGPSADTLRRLLIQQQLRGSIALLGGCGGVLPAKMSDVTGGEINYLGKAANGSQDTGIVPYLLTALGTGGQMIYVREDQLGSAADILRAQVANSAGAGKWSDYVSDNFTYRWDRLEAGEYQWFPAESLGSSVDQIPTTGYLTYNLPTPFSYYGAAHASVGVNQDGVIEFSPCASPCPFVRFTRSFLDVLSTDMQWDFIPIPPATAAAGAAPDQDPVAPSGDASNDSTDTVLVPASANTIPCDRLAGPPAQRLPGPQVCVFQANLGFEWHIISVQGYDLAGRYRAYQVWLNTNTGEIRYQYGALNGEAATAQIGVRLRYLLPPPGATVSVLASNGDAAGAQSGMGYKFTPAPPQPTRTYTVAVDALMEGVGFLQTGYSGRFEPMIVRNPAGQVIDCADTANVLCITLNNAGDDRMVQYVQVNTAGQPGDWTATIDAQTGSEGTFTFSALAASSVQATTSGDHDLPVRAGVRIALNLGRAADGGVLTAWLQRPNGDRLGGEFLLYDDGLHGDGRAGDGLFSLSDFTVPGPGVAYLWVQGVTGGVPIVRSDPTPYNFQPLEVRIADQPFAFLGSEVVVPVQITNYDNVTQCFAYGDKVIVPDGWSYFWALPPGDDGSEQLFGVCMAPGQTIDRQLLVTPDAAFAAGPSLATGEVSVTFVERERGAIVASDAATITRYRAAALVTILNPLGEASIRPNGVDSATLTVSVKDALGWPVADGTEVQLTTDLGALRVNGNSAAPVAPVITAQTKNGRVAVDLIAGTTAGDATVNALALGLPASTLVHIRQAGVHTLALVAAPADLSAATGSSTLVATVRDTWGDPVPGAVVRIGVSDDTGTQGALTGGVQVITGVTDAAGQLTAAFIKAAGAAGTVVVRAETLVAGPAGLRPVAEDSEVLLLSAAAREERLYLPLVRR